MDYIIEIINRSKELGMDEDIFFYEMLLRQLGQYGYQTMAGLDKEILKSVFVLSCSIIQTYRPKGKYKLPFMLKQVEKAMLTKNFTHWVIASLYQ